MANTKKRDNTYPMPLSCCHENQEIVIIETAPPTPNSVQLIEYAVKGRAIQWQV